MVVAYISIKLLLKIHITNFKEIVNHFVVVPNAFLEISFTEPYDEEQTETTIPVN